VKAILRTVWISRCGYLACFVPCWYEGIVPPVFLLDWILITYLCTYLSKALDLPFNPP